MELNIKNFASIKEASIKIDGITVIAGENNTGKSTIGKILFASFNSLRDIDKEVRLNILNSINRQWDNFVLDLITMHKTDMDISILYDILSNILNVEDEDIEKIISNNVGEYIDINDKFIIEAIKSTANRIKEYKNISKDKLSYNIISKYYNDLFYKQINSRIFKNTNAKIEINDFGILLEFKDDKCANFKKDIYDNNVFLIDNPFVLDIEDYSYSPSIPDSYLISEIHDKYNEDYIVDKTLAEEKLEIIYKMLSNAINGKIIKKENDFYLAFDNITEPISIHNISAGLKSFTIIKMMLEESILKEKDILVLDEPEIHLHPKWQLLYAEIIVLIQKVFNLHIVITTHSPYFLESIELFTKKHGINDKTNYYLSDINIKENYSTINLVNDKVYDIYRKMAIPFKYLEKLSDEL
ncbi:AAA family ATPase [uncultured Brachyspira sp.]|uniref:AAA family ATPase n=1 Tax=uncultured Brachyspira sp. TaxID=221953 RepID=UPI0025882DB0|nr:AAA family ATPase [uncultured Brachyspira sp.]